MIQPFSEANRRFLICERASGVSLGTKTTRLFSLRQTSAARDRHGNEDKPDLASEPKFSRINRQHRIKRIENAIHQKIRDKDQDEFRVP